MKKTLFLLLFFSLFSVCFGNYSPTIKDKKLLDSVYQKTDNYVSGDLSKALEISRKIDTIIDNFSSDTRIYYILKKLQNYCENKLSLSQKEKITEDSPKQKIFSKYWTEILTDIDTIKPCMKKYDQIDKIAKDMNFPTPLIIATWWMETTCKSYNPSNSHGIFQIQSYDYWTWEFGEEDFQRQIKDFINFSKNKRKRQNNSHVAWENDIDITYKDYSIKDLRLHWYLYNWIYDRTSPSTSMYNNWNLNSKFENNKDWLITVFLKVINRELENKD